MSSSELPVDHLSVSSLTTLAMCPERWRRRYVERDYEPPSGPMTLGKAFGAAEAQSDHTWIESGEPLDTEAVLDSYSDEFDHAADEDVDWKGEKPATLKDSGAAATKAYHSTLIPETRPPLEAEREARLDVDGVEFLAYLDVETEDGLVIDRKMTKQRWSQDKADADLQATGYLATKRAEGNPSTFAFDTAVRVKQPYAERLSTGRSDDQLDDFLARILGAAEEIEWRMESGNWSYAPPGAWWCSEKQCGYWSSCPAGGLLRQSAAKAGRAT